MLHGFIANQDVVDEVYMVVVTNEDFVDEFNMVVVTNQDVADEFYIVLTNLTPLLTYCSLFAFHTIAPPPRHINNDQKSRWSL